MSRTPSTFKQADIERAIKSAEAAGFKVETVEVVTPGGTIIRVIGPRKEACSHAPANPWDQDDDA